MNVLDRARVEWAIRSYDWWLDLRGANGRRRRELRRELRANLMDAAQHVGARDAVRALGGTQQMAVEAIPADRARPRWSVGISAGLVAAAATLLVQFLTALAWLDGVLAAGPDGRVSGSITLHPGSSLQYAPQASGFSMTFSPGWSALVVGLLVLVAVARPWRLRTGPAGRRRSYAVASGG